MNLTIQKKLQAYHYCDDPVEKLRLCNPITKNPRVQLKKIRFQGVVSSQIVNLLQVAKKVLMRVFYVIVVLILSEVGNHYEKGVIRAKVS